MFRNFQEAQEAFEADRAHLESMGVVLNGAVSYMTPDMKRDYNLAMDALIAMDALPTSFTVANSAVPAYLTTVIDPTSYKVLFAANKAAKILGGEVKKGSWTDETVMFAVVEHTGEVSSYDDFSESGRAGANTNWPQRQSYLFQTMKEYGDRELDRAGLARLNWVSEVDTAAALALAKFMNLTYFYGVAGLQCYGLLNDPALSSAIAPGVKTAGNGNRWIFNGQINATANEVYADIQALFLKLVQQSGGLIEKDDEMILALGTDAAVALTATNSFNVSVSDLLQKNFPNIRFETAVQYNARSATNPQGNAAGNLMQLIAVSVESQKTGFCAYNEKARTHPIVRGSSSYRQKVTAGTFGAVIPQPFAIAAMVGL